MGDAAESTHQHGGVSRRTVITAAAWSTPLIAVAAAAPAMAASVVRQLEFNNFTVWNQYDVIAGTTSVRPVGTEGESLETLTVTFTFPADGIAGGTPVYSGAGWVANPPSVSDGVITYTFTYTGHLEVNESTSILQFSLAVTDPPLEGSQDWSATTTSDGWEPDVAAGTVVGPNVDREDLAVAVGEFGYAAEALQWDGATVTYGGSDASPAASYTAHLVRNGIAIATLSGGPLEFDENGVATVPAVTRNDPESGAYSVLVTIYGSDGEYTYPSDPVTVE